MNQSETYLTKQFALLCVSSALFFGSFNMVIPELPDYLTGLGGEDYKGLIISLFTLTAMASRPFSGKLTDTIGRIPVMVFGSAVCVIVALLYPLLASVSGFLTLRFLHGMSTGFKPTATAAYIADIVPDSKRGEAMGILGVATSSGMAIGPAIGGWVASISSIDVVFYLSSFIGLISVLVIIGMKETVPEKQPFQWKLLKVNWREFYEPRVLGPSITFLLTAFSFGIVLTIVPDLSKHLGIDNKGLFFTIFVIASLAVRLIAGKASDRFGRVKVLKVSALSIATAMLTIGFAENAFQLMFAAALFGLAVGMNSPTIFAWTIDLSDTKFRGRAMATMYIALEIGIGSGAFLSAEIYDNNPNNFGWSFWIGTILSLIAFAYLIVWQRLFAKKYS
jgi:MFS family permease